MDQTTRKSFKWQFSLLVICYSVYQEIDQKYSNVYIFAKSSNNMRISINYINVDSLLLFLAEFLPNFFSSWLIPLPEKAFLAKLFTLESIKLIIFSASNMLPSISKLSKVTWQSSYTIDTSNVQQEGLFCFRP